jgi:CHAP domain/FG-GAP-like repeat
MRKRKDAQVKEYSGWRQTVARRAAALMLATTTLSGGAVGATISVDVAGTAPQAQAAVSRDAIVEVLRDQIGVSEANGQCDRYGVDCSQTAWCAAFTNWVWKKAGVTPVPTTLVARGVGDWGVDRHLFKRENPLPGDVVVYGEPAPVTGGHVGMVEAVHGDGTITTIEGNYDNKVTRRSHIDPDRATGNGHHISGYVTPPNVGAPPPAIRLNFSQTASADFTGDRQADIIARDGAGRLRMWTHNPEGYFNAPRQVTGGWNFTETVAADVTGDGKADLIARDDDGELFRWNGYGNGTFAAKVRLTGGWNFTQTAAADFDGDGKADLIARDGAGVLHIWAGRGDGTFAESARLTGGWNFDQTVSADFTGDGQADILAADRSNNLKLWRHNRGGYFDAPVQVTGGWAFSQPAAADYDGDGKADLIARDDSTGRLYIWAGRGNGTFGAKAHLTGGW